MKKPKKPKRKLVKRRIAVTWKNLNSLTCYPKAQKFRAFKLSEADGTSPYFPERKPTLICKQGAVLRVKKANTDVNEPCGAGVNVATKEWCVATAARWSKYFGRVWSVHFTGRDIACVPHYCDGDKFRLFRCTVAKKVKG